MIPAPLPFIILTFAAYRVVRLIGWDDLPPIQRVRNRLTGARSYHNATEGGPRVQYSRPMLAHFLGCAFCQGAWVCLAVWGAWLLEPTWTLYAAVPLAMSGAVGLIAKNLDP